MKYMGSKNRLSKELAPIIQSYVDQPWCKGYLEPFVGGANMIDKIRCERKFGSDINKYLISLLQHVQANPKDLPTIITEQEYKKVMVNKDNYEDWYIGFVGFCCSFGAKFFGGYARGKTDKGACRNYALESYKNLNKQAPNLRNIKFKCCDFQEINKIKNFVIYCDIPYRNTTKYSESNFPYDKFYGWCRDLSKDNVVLISEYDMPNTFRCIWSKKTSVNFDSSRTSGDIANKRVEKLFIYKG